MRECPLALAHTALLVIHDSMYVFQNGGPHVSFASRARTFSYEDVMGQSVRPTGPTPLNRHPKAAA
jgi:hypothetical protein